MKNKNAFLQKKSFKSIELTYLITLNPCLSNGN